MRETIEINKELLEIFKISYLKDNELKMLESEEYNLALYYCGKYKGFLEALFLYNLIDFDEYDKQFNYIDLKLKSLVFT